MEQTTGFVATPSPRAMDIPSRRLLWRALAVVAVLACEVLFVTVRFDTKELERSTHWSTNILLAAPQSATGALFGLLAALMCGGSTWRRSIEDAALVADWPTRRLRSAVFHVLAFAAFYAASDLVFSRQFAGLSWPAAAVLSWIAAGVAVVATLGLVALPSPAWVGLARSQSRPLLMGVFVIPVAIAAGIVTQWLWTPLSQATFGLVRWMLECCGQEVWSQPAERVIGVEGYGVRIAEACSGLEGIGLVGAFLIAYLWWFRATLRFPAALWVLPIGLASIWIANSFRIASLILIGAYGSREIASGGFHSQAGSMLFAAVGLGMVAISRRFRVDATTARAHAEVHPSAAYLVPLLVLLAVTMVTGVWAHEFDYLYPVRLGAVGVALWWYRKQYSLGGWTWSWSAAATGVLVFGVWLALEPLAGVSTTKSPWDALSDWGTVGTSLWLASRVVGSVVTVPIAEELAFRGYLSRRLVSANFQEVPLNRRTWAAWIASSLAFGAMHGDRWIAGTIAGMLFGAAMYRRGRLGDAIIAHAIANLFVAGYVLATGEWSLW